VTVTEPRLFTQHIVRTVARYATETLRPEERASLEAGVADQATASRPPGVTPNSTSAYSPM
jgi:hypothetical protein